MRFNRGRRKPNRLTAYAAITDEVESGAWRIEEFVPFIRRDYVLSQGESTQRCSLYLLPLASNAAR